MKSFGAFLKYIRKQRNLTQEQVAESLNIVTPVLSKWENDKAIPPLDLLCKLCNVLNISIDECINSELSDGERQLPPEQYDPEKLGETIKDLRIKNGWSQAEVGKKLFVTSQTVSKWESGGISSLEVLGKLAELFGMTPTELLNGLERMRILPEKQIAAEQLKKPNRLILKVTAIVLAAIILIGAVAGLIVGLVLKYNKNEDDLNDGDKTQTEQPDDGEQKQPEASNFVTPIKEFYSVHPAGQDSFGNFKLGCMFFEVAENTPVYAIDEGKIISVSDIALELVYVKIEHSDGFVSEYSYLNEELIVGQEVKKGQQLGTIYNLKMYEQENYPFYLNLYLEGAKVDPFEYITKLPEPVERPPEHVHEWGEWQNSNYVHWQNCECGEKSELEEHTFADNKCSVCGYTLPDIDKTAFCLPMQSKIYRAYKEDIIYDDGGSASHHGVDFSANAGDKIYAVADGEIEKITDRTGCYIIRNKHSNGVVSVYSGVIPVDNVSEGCQVKKGDLIASVSKNSIESESHDGPHLHFGISVNGKLLNPLDYIPYEEPKT